MTIIRNDDLRNDNLRNMTIIRNIASSSSSSSAFPCSVAWPRFTRVPQHPSPAEASPLGLPWARGQGIKAEQPLKLSFLKLSLLKLSLLKLPFLKLSILESSLLKLAPRSAADFGSTSRWSERCRRCRRPLGARCCRSPAPGTPRMSRII